MKIAPNDVWVKVDEVESSMFKDYHFVSWETGFDSTERKNKARVRKLLDLFDELNSSNIKDESLFYFCAQLIKQVLSKDYEIIGNNKFSYTIKKKFRR